MLTKKMVHVVFMVHVRGFTKYSDTLWRIDKISGSILFNIFIFKKYNQINVH